MKKLDRAFVLIFTAIIVFVVFGTHIKPEQTVSHRENRTLSLFPRPTLRSFLEGKFQKLWEEALKDQIVFSEELKGGQASMKNNATRLMYALLSTLDGEKKTPPGSRTADSSRYAPHDFIASYIPRGEGVYEIRETGNLVVFAYDPDTSLPIYADKIRMLRESMALAESKSDGKAHADYYLYYIEGPRDVDFKNNTATHLLSSYLYENCRDFAVVRDWLASDVETYGDLIFKTDHHFNHKGQKLHYETVIRMMFGESEPLLDLRPVLIEEARFVGSRGRTIGDFGTWDDFSVNTAELPPYDVYINTLPGQHGLIREYLDGTADLRIEVNHYGACFGADRGLLLYDFHQTEKPNLLIVADSNSNPINHFIASHFNRTYVVDMRHFKDEMGKHFSMSDLIVEYGIDKVLFIYGGGFMTRDNTYFEPSQAPAEQSAE